MKDSLEVRWYKGKYKVRVIIKAKRNWLVEPEDAYYFETTQFTCPARLLWRHKRE